MVQFDEDKSLGGIHWSPKKVIFVIVYSIIWICAILAVKYYVPCSGTCKLILYGILVFLGPYFGGTGFKFMDKHGNKRSSL